MNLSQLQTKQAELDQYIIEEHNLQGQNLLKKKTVALLTELYECVNEGRWFKFWSKNQQANNKELINPGMTKQGHDPIYANPLLEEYVDVTHFVLSIANDLNYKEHKYKDPKIYDLNDLVLGLSQLVSTIPYAKTLNIGLVFDYLIKLGYQLGFDEKTVVDAYFEKNKENFARQDSGVY